MISAYFVALGCAAGYLLGMSLVGYLCLLGMIKVRCARRRVVFSALVATHYALGLGAMFVVPLLAYRALRSQLPIEFGLAFGATTLLSVAAALWVAKEWSRDLANRLSA
jgi:hypothetical protein